MSNTILKELLKEYSQKRISSEKALDIKLQHLYSSNPRLKEINDEINLLSISIAKLIITPNELQKNNFEEKINLLKAEKADILTKLEISNSFFKPHYECIFCNDTGYVLDNNNSVMCTCLKQKIIDIEYNKSNINNLNKENFDTFDENLYSDESDEKKYKTTLSPKKNILLIKNICETFVSDFDTFNEKNLLFTGNTGLGKTFLSNCIAKELLSKGKTVLYQTSSVMLDTIIDYRFGKNNSSKDFYSNLLDVDLLIIDDLGTETPNSIKLTELFNIINSRLLNQNKKPTKTIISTNLTLQNLFKNYDERLVSRFIGYYQICRFFGDDIRFKKQIKKD